MLSCIACSPNKKNSVIQNNENLYVVDLDVPAEDSCINYSSIFSNVKTIILETNKDPFVGSISKLMVFDKFLFILDSQTKSLLVFDDTGKFVQKIGAFGRGPGEYTRVFDFTIDTDNRIIYLLCNLVINKYRMDGTFIGAINLYGHTSYIQYAHNKIYAESRGDCLLQEIDPENGKQTGKYLKANHYNKGWKEQSFWFEGGPFKYYSDVSPKYVHLFMDTIFTIQPSGLLPFLAVKSEYTVTNADIKSTEGMEPYDRIKAMFDKNKVFCIRNNYFETKKHIYFSYHQNYRMYSILYCLSTNTYRKVCLQNDFVFIGEAPFFPNFCFSDATGVYECFDDVVLTGLLEYIKKGKISNLVDKRDELMKLTENTNPVIFYYAYD